MNANDSAWSSGVLIVEDEPADCGYVGLCAEDRRFYAGALFDREARKNGSRGARTRSGDSRCGTAGL